MKTARYACAAASGASMTLVLFWLMQALIAVSPLAPPQKEYPPPVIGRIPPEPLPDRTIPPKRPAELPLPPPRSVMRTIATDSGIPATVTVPVALPAAFRPFEGFVAGRELPLVALVQVSPSYPPAAIRRDLDGYVIVEFDVTAAGTVDNVRVLESSDAAFERSAVEAAQRFRFKPRVVDGVPSPARGIRRLFRYRMGDG